MKLLSGMCFTLAGVHHFFKENFFRETEHSHLHTASLKHQNAWVALFKIIEIIACRAAAGGESVELLFWHLRRDFQSNQYSPHEELFQLEMHCALLNIVSLKNDVLFQQPSAQFEFVVLFTSDVT